MKAATKKYKPFYMTSHEVNVLVENKIESFVDLHKLPQADIERFNKRAANMQDFLKYTGEHVEFDAVLAHIVNKDVVNAKFLHKAK